MKAALRLADLYGQCADPRIAYGQESLALWELKALRAMVAGGQVTWCGGWPKIRCYICKVNIGRKRPNDFISHGRQHLVDRYGAEKVAAARTVAALVGSSEAMACLRGVK